MLEIERRRLVKKLMEHFEVMSGEEWERFGHRMTETILEDTLAHRGQTVAGKPIGYTLDSVSQQATRVAEYSSEERYFVDLAKPKKDYAHVRALHPQAQDILLLSNRSATRKRLTEIANWEFRASQRDGVTLAVMSAEEIAVRVVDHVLPDRMLVERLGPYLEVLRQLEAEYAMTHLVPPLPKDAIRRRDLERDIRAKLAADRVVVLAGMSGMGKTVAATAVANDERKTRTVIWIEDHAVNSVADLEAVDVAQRGFRLPLLGLLRNRPCLLVLDDLRCGGDIGALVAELREKCGEKSAVLITSQIAASSEFTVDTPFLTDGEARRLLEFGADPCPPPLRAQIISDTGRLPAALALLNGSTRAGVTWDRLRHDASRVAEFPVQRKADRLANALLERWREPTAPGLRVFLWADTPRLQEGFYRRLATNPVVDLIRQIRFTDDGVVDTHRLHDIAWAAVRGAEPPIVVDGDRLETILEGYVRDLAANDAWTMELNHFARLHQPLLTRLVRSGTAGPGALYAWLHHPGRIGVSDLPDPVAFAETTARNPTDTFCVQAASELAEAFARISIAESKKDGTPVDGDRMLLPFDLLLKSDQLAPEARFHVRHHRAKTLKRLYRFEDAVAECDLLLEEAGPLPATRLLVARTLTEGTDAGASAAGVRARTILLELLDEAAMRPDEASISVTLAAAELLRRRVVRPDWKEVFSRFGDLFERVILRAYQRGLEQSVLALAGLASDWAKHDPARLVKLIKLLDAPSAESIQDEEELAAWGEVFSTLADADASDRESHLRRALSYFSRCVKDYGLTHRADVITRMGRPADALDVLEELVDLYPRRARDTWVLQRKAEALLALGDAAGALDCSNAVVGRFAAGDRHFDYVTAHHRRILDRLQLP